MDRGAVSSRRTWSFTAAALALPSEPGWKGAKAAGRLRVVLSWTWTPRKRRNSGTAAGRTASR